MRVIAGRARGRRLEAPRGAGTRPTSDRVREALFSALAPILEGARVLDLFAGSGALGIEALSRGAASAVLVERDRRAAAVISRNLERCGLAGGAVRAVDVGRYCREPTDGPFDIVLADPPYEAPSSAVSGHIAALAAAGALAPGATLVIERGSGQASVEAPPGMTWTRTRAYGDTVLLWGRAEEPDVTVAVCPGSFDPVTYGHLDVIERAASRFDGLIVACTSNVGKKPMFDLDERIELLEACTAHLANVEIAPFDGLLVDFCVSRGVGIVVKGLRAVSDFEYELQMAQMNGRLGDVETLFLTTSPVYSFLSSSLVKEVARFGGDVRDFVPEVVADRLAQK